MERSNQIDSNSHNKQNKLNQKLSTYSLKSIEESFNPENKDAINMQSELQKQFVSMDSILNGGNNLYYTDQYSRRTQNDFNQSKNQVNNSKTISMFEQNQFFDSNDYNEPYKNTIDPMNISRTTQFQNNHSLHRAFNTIQQDQESSRQQKYDGLTEQKYKLYSKISNEGIQKKRNNFAKQKKQLDSQDVLDYLSLEKQQQKQIISLKQLGQQGINLSNQISDLVIVKPCFNKNSMANTRNAFHRQSQTSIYRINDDNLRKNI